MLANSAILLAALAPAHSQGVTVGPCTSARPYLVWLRAKLSGSKDGGGGGSVLRSGSATEVHSVPFDLKERVWIAFSG